MARKKQKAQFDWNLVDDAPPPYTIRRKPKRRMGCLRGCSLVMLGTLITFWIILSGTGSNQSTRGNIGGGNSTSLRNALSNAASPASITFYEEQTRLSRIVVDLEATSRGASSATALNIMAQLLRAYKQYVGSNGGLFTVRVYYGTSNRCAVGAGMDRAAMERINWSSVSQSGLFQALNREQYGDTTSAVSYYSPPRSNC